MNIVRKMCVLSGVLTLVMLVVVFPRMKSDSDKASKRREYKFPTINFRREKQSFEFKERFVHLDLKGAPPRVSYLKELLGVAKRAGATGLLIEWEDMFPYEDDLKVLRSGYSYSSADVAAILGFAKEQGLQVIPLIQTFGHMEWVLKHKEFEKVREISRYPQVLCPSNPESFKLVKKLIDQVMKLHPEISAFHIGADEAYYVGKECGRCKERVEGDGSKLPLMLEHVGRVAKYLREEHKLERVLIWHDMFEKAGDDLLGDLAALVEPVIWKYSPDLSGSDGLHPEVMRKFSRNFKRLWAASAFKGADGPAQTFLNISRYLSNHRSWMEAVSASSSRAEFTGIILTGWQRFDHFAGLCELLPPAVPSLVTNLLFLTHGNSQQQPFLAQTKTFLDCAPMNESEFYAALCQFPGRQLSSLVDELKVWKNQSEFLNARAETHGWLAPYNLKHQYGSVFRAEQYFNASTKITQKLTNLGGDLRREMTKIFFEDTVNEWLFSNVHMEIQKLKKIEKACVGIMHTTEFRSRPLDKDDLPF